jgi:hypothetical protein
MAVVRVASAVWAPLAVRVAVALEGAAPEGAAPEGATLERAVLTAALRARARVTALALAPVRALAKVPAKAPAKVRVRAPAKVLAKVPAKARERAAPAADDVRVGDRVVDPVIAGRHDGGAPGVATLSSRVWTLVGFLVRLDGYRLRPAPDRS